MAEPVGKIAGLHMFAKSDIGQLHREGQELRQVRGTFAQGWKVKRMPCAYISRNVLAAVTMVLLVWLDLVEQQHLFAFSYVPQTGMFQA